MELTKVDLYLGAAIIIILGIGFYIHLKGNETAKVSKRSLGIKELIDSVRHELELAEDGRIKRGDPPLFEVKDFDMEIKFVVNKSLSNSGKLELSVVTLDGGKTESSELVQTIHLHMNVSAPVSGTAKPINNPAAIDTTGIIDIGKH